jgi:hypothetical protein
MGCEIYITRAAEFWRTAEQPISEAEWIAFAASNPGLQLSVDDFYSRRTERGAAETFHPWLMLDLEGRPPLWYMDGALHMKNPDRAALIRMHEIATALGALLIDEDDREYGSDGNPKLHR